VGFGGRLVCLSGKRGGEDLWGGEGREGCGGGLWGSGAMNKKTRGKEKSKVISSGTPERQKAY